MQVRLQKWLSEKGVASRREAEALIREGLITVNGKMAELGVKIDPAEDAIRVKNKLIQKTAIQKQYWLLNKPDKFLVSRRDEKAERRTVYDLPAVRKLGTILPTVGRLDFRTEGLLILSNDGEFVFRLTHPRFKVSRTYHVLANKALTDSQLAELKKGITLYGKPLRVQKIQPRHTEVLGASKGQWYEVVVAEGRYRVVRRIFEHFETKVIRLVRVAYGDVWLPPTLLAGHVQPMSPQMVQSLKRSIGMIGPQKKTTLKN